MDQNPKRLDVDNKFLFLHPELEFERNRHNEFYQSSYFGHLTSFIFPTESKLEFVAQWDRTLAAVGFPDYKGNAHFAKDRSSDRINLIVNLDKKDIPLYDFKLIEHPGKSILSVNLSKRLIGMEYIEKAILEFENYGRYKPVRYIEVGDISRLGDVPSEMIPLVDGIAPLHIPDDSKVYSALERAAECVGLERYENDGKGNFSYFHKGKFPIFDPGFRVPMNMEYYPGELSFVFAEKGRHYKFTELTLSPLYPLILFGEEHTIEGDELGIWGPVEILMYHQLTAKEPAFRNK
ncbi:MAG: hypothetical protein HGA85_04695 [Nanoarchaeota archaeon]|nr:hypothetical protein [Nanoarchaeota archaeon]